MRVEHHHRLRKVSDGIFILHRKVESFDAPYVDCFYIHMILGITQRNKKLKFESCYTMEWRKSTWLQSTIKSKTEDELKKAEDAYFKNAQARCKRRKKKKKKGENEEEAAPEPTVEPVEESWGSFFYSQIQSISLPPLPNIEVPEVNWSVIGPWLLVFLVFMFFWTFFDQIRRSSDHMVRIRELERKMESIMEEMRNRCKADDEN